MTTRQKISPALRSFYETGDILQACAVMEICIKEKIWHIGCKLGEYFLDTFPENNILLYNTAVCALNMNTKDDKAFAQHLFSRLARMENNTLPCVGYIADMYTAYPKDIVDKLTTRQANPLPMITLTITTCKRFDLFEKTMNSFLTCCLDIDKVDNFFCVDDNSSPADQKQMQELYPFFKFYFKTPSEKGHPKSMNIIRDQVKTPFIFHMEDDWKFFIQENYITYCLDVISQSPQIGQCLINKNYAETEKDTNIVGGFPNTTPSGKKYYIHEHYSDNQGMVTFIKQHGNKPQCAYWPHFSFRPSLIKKVILDKIGKFNEGVAHFEMDYSYKYRDHGFISAFMKGIFCLHTGRLTSERFDTSRKNAYILNNEKQFSNTADEFPFNIFVINLDKRPDRWKNFEKNAQKVDFTTYTRFSAIDGSRLVPTEQLQRIFDNNDYNMREGMVGCALSHLKLYCKLIEDNIHSAYCILEDDIQFIPDFKKKLKELVSSLPENWDMCYLGHHLWPQYRTSQFFDINKTAVAEKWDTAKSLKYSMGGTGGYLISKKGAKKLLEFIEKTGMTNGIDTVQQKSADTLNIYYSNPHLIFSECADDHPNTDTDIQRNFKSLTIPIDTRYENIKNTYRKSSFQNYTIVGTFETAREYVLNPHVKNVMFYRGKDIQKLLSISIHPCYSLDGKIFICVPGYSSPTGNKLYYRVMPAANIFSIDEAVVYKQVISLSGTTHVSEAITSLYPSTEEYPFDKIDGGNFETFKNILFELKNIELKNNGTDISLLSTFSKEFCDLKGLRENKYGIAFPHEEMYKLTETYTKKFTNIYNILIKVNNTLINPIILFIHTTRWEKVNPESVYAFLDTFPSCKLLIINGFPKDITPTHNRLLVDYIDFPEKFAQEEGWPQEKLYYDQTVFRPAIMYTIKKYIPF